MHKVIDVLMGEHRLIERVLASLESFAGAVDGGLSVERPLVARYAVFFRKFADACHHGKEEDILFQHLIEHGFSRDAGPVAVMLHEHTVGRAHVAELRRVGEAAGTVSLEEARRIVETSESYVPLLRAHILKEDRILYPMALRTLSTSELDAMETAFGSFERALRADGTYDRLQALAEGLVAAFPPDAARMARAAQGAGCWAS